MELRSKRWILPGVISISLTFFVYSCSARSTVRYDRDKEKKVITNESEKKKFVEDFDITPYRTEIDIKEKSINNAKTPELNPWYGYEEKDTSSNHEKTIVGATNGFRVQVSATDNLEEADSLKSELSQKILQKNIYVIFDPPFYKVEIGDFTNMNDAKDLNFKLNQMGYTESRVISSTINVFE